MNDRTRTNEVVGISEGVIDNGVVDRAELDWTGCYGSDIGSSKRMQSGRQVSVVGIILLQQDDITGHTKSRDSEKK